MQAAITREAAPAPVLEQVELEAPRQGEALVRILACGVCHTDIKVHHRPGPKPIVLGHEGAGIVERLGPGPSDLAIGDHVVIGANHCGICLACTTGRPSYCREARARNFGGARPDGTTPISQAGMPIHARFFGQSSFAQYALIDTRAAVAVRPELPLHILAPLGCGVITGAGSILRSLRVRVGQSVAIFGAGAVGLSAVIAASLAGASQIIVVDPVTARLQLAEDFGATATLAPADGDVVTAIHDVSRGGVDFTLNTTTSVAVFDQAVASLGPFGTAGYVAPPSDVWTPDLVAMMDRGQSVRGITGGDIAPRQFVPMLIDLYCRDKFPFDRMITTYGFAEISDAFHDSEIGEAIKPVLIMGNEDGPAAERMT
jgi:aryl-alcohol dehydrogenase